MRPKTRKIITIVALMIIALLGGSYLTLKFVLMPKIEKIEVILPDSDISLQVSSGTMRIYKDDYPGYTINVAFIENNQELFKIFLDLFIAPKMYLAIFSADNNLLVLQNKQHDLLIDIERKCADDPNIPVKYQCQLSYPNKMTFIGEVMSQENGELFFDNGNAGRVIKPFGD